MIRTKKGLDFYLSFWAFRDGRTQLLLDNVLDVHVVHVVHDDHDVRCDVVADTAAGNVVVVGTEAVDIAKKASKD